MAQFIGWEAEYETGIKEVDDQHKFLVEVINELFNAFMEKKHDEELKEIIKKLEDYTIFHFRTEEEYFKPYEFSYKETHLNAHKYFIEQVQKFRDDYYNARVSITFTILNFLRKWLIEHIQGTDKKTFQELRDKKVI